MLNTLNKLNAFVDKFTSRDLSTEIERGKIDYKKARDSSPSFIKRILALVQEVMDSFKATDLFGVSAQMAFIILLAFLPTLLFIIYICDQFVPNFDHIFLGILMAMLPKESSSYISSELGTLFDYINKLQVPIILGSTFMGTLSAHTILTGLNQTYGLKTYSSKKWEWTKSFIILIGLVLLLSALTLLSLRAGLIASQILKNTADVNHLNSIFWGVGIFSGVFIILLLLYTFTPERRIKLIDALPGTIFAVLGILVVFEIYVQILNRSANYLLVYGSMSGLFILLTALYFLSMIVNLGAKVNVAFAKNRTWNM